MVHLKTYLLSGGKSSRMGEDKGLKLLLGKPMIGYLLDMLKKHGIIPTIIAHHLDYKAFDVTVIQDKINDKGPLGGIYTALCDAGEDVLILSADTPFITIETITYLIENQKENTINILNFNGKIQPLCGIYPIDLLDEFESAIYNDNLKMMSFLAENNANIIRLNGENDIFTNINTPEDIALAEKRLTTNF